MSRLISSFPGLVQTRLPYRNAAVLLWWTCWCRVLLCPEWYWSLRGALSQRKLPATLYPQFALLVLCLLVCALPLQENNHWCLNGQICDFLSWRRIRPVFMITQSIKEASKRHNGFTFLSFCCFFLIFVLTCRVLNCIVINSASCGKSHYYMVSLHKAAECNTAGSSVSLWSSRSFLTTLFTLIVNVPLLYRARKETKTIMNLSNGLLNRWATDILEA